MRLVIVGTLLLASLYGNSNARADEVLRATDGSDVLAEGAQAEGAGDLEHAENLFRQAAILPDMQEKGTVALARVLIAEHKAGEAKLLLKNFVKEVNPFSADAHVALLDIALSAEQNTVVEEEISTLSKLRPGYEPFQERRAILAFRSGDYKKAADSLSRVLVSEPNHPRALGLRYQAYMKLGMYPQAAADVERMIQLAPANDQNYWALASVYANLGRAESAVATIKRGMNVAREEKSLVSGTIAYATVAEIWVNQAKYSYAKEALKLGSQLGVRTGVAKARISFVAGEVMEAENQFDRAEGFYQKAFAADPRHAENGIKFAQILAHNGSAEKASRVMAQVVAFNPENENYAKRLMEYYKTADRKDQLGTFLKNFLDDRPTETWALVEYVHLLASIDSLSAAESTLARAVETEGASSDIFLLYAKVLDHEQKYDKAAHVLTAAAESHPKDARIRFDLGLVQEHAGNLTKAEQAYRAVPISDQELYFQARVNLGLLEQKSGNIDKALTTFSSLRSKVGESDELVTKIRELTDRIHGTSASPIRSVASEGIRQ